MAIEAIGAGAGPSGSPLAGAALAARRVFRCERRERERTTSFRAAASREGIYLR